MPGARQGWEHGALLSKGDGVRIMCAIVCSDADQQAASTPPHLVAGEGLEEVRVVGDGIELEAVAVNVDREDAAAIRRECHLLDLVRLDSRDELRVAPVLDAADRKESIQDDEEGTGRSRERGLTRCRSPA
eukprot:1138096-Rhodomonas_salina.1